MWILIPALKEKCELLIRNNPQLKLSKVVYRNGSFVFYREHACYDSKEKYETAEFRICLAKGEKGKEGFCVSYLRHTGKWHDLPIFGSFDHCLKQIRGRKWGALCPY